MQSAHVTSVEELLRFRQALVRFQEEGLSLLTGLDQQSQRLLQWLEGEAPAHWRVEVLRCHELISRARSALETAMMKKSRDYTPSCIEEKQQLQWSRQRLVQAEEKREQVRRWARLAREEIDEYRGRVAPLRDLLEQQIPRALARLDNTVQSLERYLETQAPAAPQPSPRQPDLVSTVVNPDGTPTLIPTESEGQNAGVDVDPPSETAVEGSGPVSRGVGESQSQAPLSVTGPSADPASTSQPRAAEGFHAPA